MSEATAPQQRLSIVGRTEVEALLRHAIERDAFSHGWLIAGPKGAGKASLAYRIARALLEPSALRPGSTLDMPAEARAFRLVAGGAHPDLFVARREYDEKKERDETEIPVDTVRDLIAFLGRTPAFGGWRVVIVDTANELNRNGANALLKALEEPPEKTAILVLSDAPGRLPATIRSRCRRLDLRPVDIAVVTALLRDEAGLAEEDAKRVATAANGRPGYALTLAAGEGPEAIAALDTFLDAIVSGADVPELAASLSGRAAEERFGIFLPALLDRLSDAARGAVTGDASKTFGEAGAAALAAAHADISELAARGMGLNLDRAQLLHAIARRLRRAVRPAAA